jgi:hypothetical protein
LSYCDAFYTAIESSIKSTFADTNYSTIHDTVWSAKHSSYDATNPRTISPTFYDAVCEALIRAILSTKLRSLLPAHEQTIHSTDHISHRLSFESANCLSIYTADNAALQSTFFYTILATLIVPIQSAYCSAINPAHQATH